MTKMLRLGIAIAGVTAAGLVVYELVREALAGRDAGMPEGPATRVAPERPPFAEAADTYSD